MKSVALHNLGCKVNAYEIDAMQQMLQQRGYKIVSFDDLADIYIVNTCTVTNIADRKSRQMLHRAKAMNPKALVVAVGCYVQTGTEAVKKDACIDLAIGNNRKKDLVTILESYLEHHEDEQEPIIDISKDYEYEELSITKTAEHTRAYIKIQDGCNQFCTYCIIPYARGRVRSRKAESILSEIEGLVKNGYQEIVITGIHISSYGIDFEEKFGLGDLLEKIHEIEGLKRIRLGSLEPRIVTKEFADRLGSMPKICPHFHLSLQSGCDATLKRMNRHYTPGEYFKSVEYLRSAFSNPGITTDVIVGFPGETEEEFQETRNFLQKTGFYEMHIFKYSKRQGTKAAEMPMQISDTEKSRRSSILLQMEKEQSEKFRSSFLGQEIEVLFEEAKEIKGKIYQIGHTPHYVKAAKETTEDLSNKMYHGKVSGFLTETIMIIE